MSLKLIMMFGLPGSGKSHWINENYGEKEGVCVVSADWIKESHPDYLSFQPEVYHEWSVQIAEETTTKAMIAKTPLLILDGGGINNSYNERIAKKAIEEGYSIQLVHMDTPLHVCLERNQSRDRTVPEDNIRRKAERLHGCLHRLRSFCHQVTTIPYYTMKHVFVDMDGTIAAYQQIPLTKEGHIDFVSCDYFLHAKPVRQVIDRLYILHQNGSRVYILSASPSGKTMEEKRQWILDHCPWIPKNRQHFIGNKKFKKVMLENLMEHNGLSKQDVTLVDDDHGVLIDCFKADLHAVHPSEFLTMNLVR